VVEIYPNSQLGGSPDIIEQAIAGANIAGDVDAGRIGNYFSDFGIMAGPYIFESYDDALIFFKSDMYKGWVDKVAEQGLRALAYNQLQGTRNVVAKKQVVRPSDLKGVLLRTMESPIAVGTIEAMGASPQTPPWSEVYTGLQTKVIDACEAQYSAIITQKLPEVAPYIARTQHFLLLCGVIMSEELYQTYSPELQSAVTEAFWEGNSFASNTNIDKAGEFEKALEGQGAKFNDVDQAEWAAITLPVYAKLGMGEIKAQMEKVIAEAK
jgi:TRAP-type C4-dicarboxylate transport system substrate-binding protein